MIFVLSSGRAATGIQDGARHDLAIITEWVKANTLSLNINKTHLMCFSAKTKQNLIYH